MEDLELLLFTCLTAIVRSSVQVEIEEEMAA